MLHELSFSVAEMIFDTNLCVGKEEIKEKNDFKKSTPTSQHKNSLMPHQHYLETHNQEIPLICLYAHLYMTI